VTGGAAVVRFSPPSGASSRVGAVLRLELLVQRREPLTALYMLVLGVLALAFAAAGPVELVRGRGDVPRDAGWSLMLASTALTAFGQVITTMVAATVVLRDHADRVHDLFAITPITAREYRFGKLLAALVMLAVIYAAIPVGLLLGAVLRGGDVVSSVAGSVRPFVLLVLPTMLAVGMLQFAVGILSGRLWTIVAVGLGLIWLWTAAVDIGSASGWARVASLLDPFASAPLLHATAAWTDAERAVLPMPVTTDYLLNRLAWLLGTALLAWRAIVRGPAVPRRAAVEPQGGHHRAQPRRHNLAPVPAQPGGEGRAGWRGVSITAAYVARWMLRDPGWRVLSVLGAVNVGVHAVIDAPRGASGAATTAFAVQVLGTHARLFLILLATIYAGELVWREREERSAAVFDALPVTTAAMLAGRVIGAFVAQCVLVVLLGATAMVGAMLATHAAGEPWRFVVAICAHVAVPFTGWLLLAVLVHVLVQQKVAAHLLLIAAWVVAVVVSDGTLATSNPRLSLLQWASLAVLAVLVSGLGWTRGVTRRCYGRGRLAGSGVEKA
jgi:ABC-2 type transport system permease protein